MTKQDKMQLRQLRVEMAKLNKLLDEVRNMTNEQCIKSFTCSKNAYYQQMTYLLARKEDAYNAIIEQGKGEVF